MADAYRAWVFRSIGGQWFRVCDGSPELRSQQRSERVLCLDADNGKIRWQYSYPCQYAGVGYGSGPRVTPAVADGKVYTLGTMGDLICLNAADGNCCGRKAFP